MITPAQAMQAFPQLVRLFTLRTTPPEWLFTQTVGPDGHVLAVNGARVWPDGHADAMGILGELDVQAVRLNPAGERVWKSTDTLSKVLDELAELPDPGTTNRFQLVIPGAVNPMHNVLYLRQAR